MNRRADSPRRQFGSLEVAHLAATKTVTTPSVSLPSSRTSVAQPASRAAVSRAEPVTSVTWSVDRIPSRGSATAGTNCHWAQVLGRGPDRPDGTAGDTVAARPCGGPEHVSLPQVRSTTHGPAAGLSALPVVFVVDAHGHAEVGCLGDRCAAGSQVVLAEIV